MHAPMRPQIRNLGGRLFPHGWQDLARQFVLFAAAYYAYSLVRGAMDGHAVAAFAHARDVIDLERSVHVFVEPAIQSWATGHTLLVDFSSWMYINAQTAVLVGGLAIFYFFFNDSYYFVRNMLLIAMGLALIGYIVFPTAPPRLLPEWGFTDTVTEFTGVKPDSAVNALFNPFAAIPSMHVGVAIMIAWPLVRLVRRRALKIVCLLYPILITFVVVATANHFLLDALLGAATAGLAALVADRLLARARPDAWAFAGATV